MFPQLPKTPKGAAAYRRTHSSLRDIEAPEDASNVRGNTHAKVEESLSDSSSEEQDSYEYDHSMSRPLEPHAFDFLICAIVHDTHAMATDRGKAKYKRLRMVKSMMLLIGCVSIQVLLMRQTKYYVTDKASRKMRIIYDEFEQTMYDGHTYVYSETPVLQRRGLGGRHGEFFNAGAFERLSESTKEASCNIPLSQPFYLGIILLLWTTTCVVDMRKTWHLFRSLVTNTGTCDSMKDVFSEDENGDKVIARLTPAAKIALTVFVLVPRFVVTAYLTWLGSRWLLGVSLLDELLLNALALEFILFLKELLYFAFTSVKSMVDLERTKILPPDSTHGSELSALGGQFLWAVFAIGWVLLYTGAAFHSYSLQTVLPHYQWDARDVCASYLHGQHT